METLLNKLMEKGWKPFNRKKTLHIICYDKCKWINYKWIHLDGWFMNEESRTLRELVSIDSGLWQFVCENGMINEGDVKNFIWTRYEHTWFEPQYHLVHKWNSAEYRLIESSLKDESELEDFLLSNIVIKDEKK